MIVHELDWQAGAPSDAVAVGDLDSDAKGSGARKNAGKPALDLVPVSMWVRRWSPYTDADLNRMLKALQAFQEGNDGAIGDWLSIHCPRKWYDEAVRVLEFGAEKYKAWNWAKGMPWSVCFGCILRHTQAIVDGEDFDPDSGRLHWGHIVCNAIFLAYYVDHYKEGDDRPPRY